MLPGQYSCRVPQGWSGSATPSLSGQIFAPPSRVYSSVAAKNAAQDCSSAASPLIAGGVQATLDLLAFDPVRLPRIDGLAFDAETGLLYVGEIERSNTWRIRFGGAAP